MSGLDLRRARPTRGVAAALVGVLWTASLGAVRDVVWADLRTGVIRLDGLPRLARNLARVGFVLLFGMVALLVLGDVLRGLSPLLASTFGRAGRGDLLPVVLVPLTLFMTVIAWTFLLAGALHAHPALRVLVVVAYAGATVNWLGLVASFGTPLQMGVGWLAIALVPVVFAVRWRATPRPGTEFVVLLVPVCTAYLLAQALAVEVWYATGFPVALTVTEANVLLVRGLVIPLLLLIGLDIAEFAYRLSGWTAQAVSQRLPAVLVFAVLVVVLAWRLGDVVLASARDLRADPSASLLAHLGAAGVPLIVWSTWWVVRRRAAMTEEGVEADRIADAGRRTIGPLVLGFIWWQVLVTVALTVVAALAVAAGGGTAAGQARYVAVSTFLGDVGLRVDLWHLLFFVGALVAGTWLLRRGMGASGFYVTLVGGIGLWLFLTIPGRPLEFLNWETLTPVDLWWVLLLVGFAVAWAVRGQLDVECAHRLLLVAFLTVLWRQTDFIENPFSPFFAFAGVAFIAFGITWDALTAGSWANEGSRHLPRSSRVFLYIGYVLFSVTVVNWAIARHDLDVVEQFTGGAAVAGFSVFGKPLIYAVLVTLLVGPFGSVGEDPLDTAGEQPPTDEGDEPVATTP